MEHAGESLSLIISRDGQEKLINVTPKAVREKDRFGNEYKIGRIGIGPPAPIFVPVSLVEAPGIATERLVAILQQMVEGIGQIITGKRPIQELGGPIKIAQISGQVATLGWQNFISLVAMISINLGFINLLPIPTLDGGHLSFYALEAVRRKPTSPRVMEMAFRSGMVALLGLMVFVTFNDLASLGIWSRLAGLIG